jgi:capsule polysaccharide export protein KpsE/RkpR
MIEQNSYAGQSGVISEEDIALEGGVAMSAVKLIAILTQLAHHKRQIAVVTGVVMLAGLAYCLMKPVQYTATTKLMTPQQTPSSTVLLMNQLAGSSAGSFAAQARSGLGLGNPNDIYIGLLKSRLIADAIIQKFGLENLYHARNMSDARIYLTINTIIESDKSGLLVVSVTDGDKNRAAEMANAYTDQLRVLTGTLAVTEASQRRLFYEEQLKHAKDDLVAAEYSFQQIQQKKGLVQLDAQTKALIESLTALHAQIAVKQVELQALRSYSTDRNPSVQLAENQLASLQAESLQLEQRSHSSGLGDLGLQDVAGAGSEYLRSEHELQYRQTLLDLLIKQYDAARLDEAKEAAVIQVVEPAIPADHKSPQRRLLTLLVLTVLGFLGACSYVLMRHAIQTNPEISRSLAGLRSAFIDKGRSAGIEEQSHAQS